MDVNLRIGGIGIRHYIHKVIGKCVGVRSQS